LEKPSTAPPAAGRAAGARRGDVAIADTITHETN
jgi:hypothetical protein